MPQGKVRWWAPAAVGHSGAEKPARFSALPLSLALVSLLNGANLAAKRSGQVTHGAGLPH